MWSEPYLANSNSLREFLIVFQGTVFCDHGTDGICHFNRGKWHYCGQSLSIILSKEIVGTLILEGQTVNRKFGIYSSSM